MVRDVFDQRPPRGPWRAIVVIAAMALVIALASLIAVTAVSGPVHHADSDRVDDTGLTTPPGTSGRPDLPARQELTLEAATQVWDLHHAAKDASDVDNFTKATCQRFIDADIALRGLTDTESLLDAYRRAKRFVPVQYIEDTTVVAATGHAPADGSIEVTATVTDNRKVPPRPEQRTLTYTMVWEKERWKLCPTTDPV